jgi:hypothetical protein
MQEPEPKDDGKKMKAERLFGNVSYGYSRVDRKALPDV